MNDTNLLEKVFLKHYKSEQLITYAEFQAAGFSYAGYMDYLTLCENFRCACILYERRIHPFESVVTAHNLMRKWMEWALDDSLQDCDDLLIYIKHPSQIYYCWEGTCYSPASDEVGNLLQELTNEDLVLLSSVLISSDDFRRRLEYYITHFWILKNRIRFIQPVVHTDKLSKRSPRESCEFFTNQSTCLLRGEPCNKDYCSDYLKNGGLPLKRLPTDEKTVDFNDTVNILSEDGRQFKIVIPSYADQRNMKLVENAMVHHKVGETVQLGPDMATYKICSIEKCQPRTKTKRKPTCLLSPWEKINKKARDLWDEQCSIHLDLPDRPSDLTDTAAITEWARGVRKVVIRCEEVDEQLQEYENWLDLNRDE